MKLGRNLIISFVLILALSVYVFILSYQSKRQAERLNNGVIHTHRVIEEITNLNAVVTEFESQDQHYVITNDKNFKKDLDSRKYKVFPKIEEIRKLTGDNKIQQENLHSLVKAIKEKIIYQRNFFKVLNGSYKEALVLIA